MSYHIFDYTTHTINKVLHDLIDETVFVYDIEKTMGILSSQSFPALTINRAVYNSINKELNNDKQNMVME
jgi:hypothetical protein